MARPVVTDTSRKSHASRSRLEFTQLAARRVPESEVENFSFDFAGRSMDRERAMRQARHWAKVNPVVRVVNSWRIAYANAGCRIVPVAGKPDERFKSWLNQRITPPGMDARDASPKRGTLLQNYIRWAWQEWFTTRMLISFWRGESFQPLLLAPEAVQYKDELGIERITIAHGLTPQQIETMWKAGQISKDLKLQLLGNQKVTLPGGMPDWHFHTLKDATAGSGLPIPPMATIYQTCAEWESHEAGDSVTAAIGRKVIEQHKLGHEFRGGTGQLFKKENHFMTKARSDQVFIEMQGKTGHILFPTNFDHEIVYSRPEAKLFDVKKYEAALERLSWWAQPFYELLKSGTYSPAVMDLVRSQMFEERELVQPHVEAVLNAPAFAWEGGPIAVRWSKSCFGDRKLFADMVRLGYAAGVMSPTTFVEATGLDPEEERERKAQDLEQPRKIFEPIYDANHGPVDQARAGKPRGTKDEG